MAKPTQVSNEFASFYKGAASDIVNKAKEADKLSSNVPVDVGVQGTCLIEGFRFGKLPDKDGVEGSAFCEQTFRILTPEEHQGKLLKRTSWFSKKNGPEKLALSFQYFYDDLVKWGLPEEVRKNHTHPSELGDWFTSNNVVLGFNVVAAKQRDQYNDGKQLYINPPKQSVAATSFIPEDATSAPAGATPAGHNFQVGQIVFYENESGWKVTGIYGPTKIGIEKNGEEHVVPPSRIKLDEQHPENGPF